MDQLIIGARAPVTRLLEEHRDVLEALQTELTHAERGVLRVRDLPSLAPVIGRGDDSAAAAA